MSSEQISNSNASKISETIVLMVFRVSDEGSAPFTRTVVYRQTPGKSDEDLGGFVVEGTEIRGLELLKAIGRSANVISRECEKSGNALSLLGED